MRNRRSQQELDITELEQLLWEKKRQTYPARRQRLRAMGRLVEAPGLAPVNGNGPTRPRIVAPVPDGPEQRASAEIAARQDKVGARRRLRGQLLLVVELFAVAIFVFTTLSLWRTNDRLNRALTEVQQAEGAALALPTPQPTAVIGVAILPGGHRYPGAGETPQPGEAGTIPAHLLPAIGNYVPPPVPTPGPEHARRIQVEAIDVDSAIYQGMYDWEVLKKGVAQHIGSAAPGQVGNMILAGHNDVYGEVFRDLDKLAPGDEIIISSERQAYRYVVRETVIVEPTDVSVMAPTDYATLTMISCYPYRVNTKRIVVLADLAIS